jgi:WD40 repeat protein
VSASDDKTIKLWSALSGECLQIFSGHQGGVYVAQFCPDDRLIISAGRDYNLKVWDIQTGKCLHALTGHSGLIYALDVGNIHSKTMDSPKSTIFSASLDETIKVWDLEAAKCIATWKSRRPYEGMQIDRIQGLTSAQTATLQALGSIG